MTVTDPIADALTRIRNANTVHHSNVEMPASNLKVELMKLLKEEGFIANYEVKENDNFKVIDVELKYNGTKPVITGLKGCQHLVLELIQRLRTCQECLTVLELLLFLQAKVY